MFQTSFYLEDLNKEDITEIYVERVQDRKPVIVASPNWWDTPILRAAGFLKSTVNDMLRYSEIFRTGGQIGNEQILTKESIKLMTEDHFESNPIVGQSYGYGLEVVLHFHGRKMIGHPGGIKGGSAQMNIIAEKGLTGIVLTNYLSTTPTAIMNAAFNCMENRPPEVSHLEYEGKTLEKELLSQYTGSYQADTVNASILIKLYENQLRAEVLNSLIVLHPVQKDIFLLEGTMDHVSFYRNENNRIISMCFKGFKFLKLKHE